MIDYCFKDGKKEGREQRRLREQEVQGTDGSEEEGLSMEEEVDERQERICSSGGESDHAVNIPVQAVGGLSLEQAIQCPAYGAPLVVLGAPLTIDADAFKTADGNLEASLRMICEKIHAFGDVS